MTFPDIGGAEMIDGGADVAERIDEARPAGRATEELTREQVNMRTQEDGPTTQSQGMLNAAWREAAKITYEDFVIGYGNDGPYETDRVLPAADRERQQAAIALIVEQTGVSSGFIRRELLEAAYAEAEALGTDEDPDYFAPPDWEDFAVRWHEGQIVAEAGRHEAALWGRLNNAPAEVQQQFWAGQEPQGHPPINESTLAAAYQAVADRSGIGLVTNPARDDRGNPILADGQGIILSDGTFLWHGPPEDLVGPAAAPTDAGQQCEGLHVNVANRLASRELTSGRDAGPILAVRRASAVFDSSGAPGTRAPVATSPPSHPCGTGPLPQHRPAAPNESPRQGRTR